MRIESFTIWQMLVVEVVDDHSQTLVEVLAWYWNLINGRVYFKYHSLSFLLSWSNKVAEYRAAFTLASSYGGNCKMLYIIIGVEFPTTNKTYKLAAIICISNEMIAWVGKSLLLLNVCTLLEDGETCCVNRMECSIKFVRCGIDVSTILRFLGISVESCRIFSRRGDKE